MRFGQNCGIPILVAFWKGFYSDMRPFKKRDFHPDQIDTAELIAYWQQELFGSEGQLAGHMK